MALPFRSALPSEAIATPTDKSVCYSGPASPGQTTNRRKAFDYARLQDLVLIDMTPAGNWLDRPSKNIRVTRGKVELRSLERSNVTPC